MPHDPAANVRVFRAYRAKRNRIRAAMKKVIVFLISIELHCA
jgi:hypothetical protein